MSKFDEKIRQHIIDALEWEPSIEASNIGVAVHNGVAELTGHVASYMEKMAAERCVQRLPEVRAISQKIEVRLPFDAQIDDDQIAERAVTSLRWDTILPSTGLRIKVENAIVTLSGEVDWHYQRKRAERLIERLVGVKDVINLIKIKARASTGDIKHKIENSFKRQATLDAKQIQVTVDGNCVNLTGKVHSIEERHLAREAAWSAPGITDVRDTLSVAL